MHAQAFWAHKSLHEQAVAQKRNLHDQTFWFQKRVCMITLVKQKEYACRMIKVCKSKERLRNKNLHDSWSGFRTPTLVLCIAGEAAASNDHVTSGSVRRGPACLLRAGPRTPSAGLQRSQGKRSRISFVYCCSLEAEKPRQRFPL